MMTVAINVCGSTGARTARRRVGGAEHRDDSVAVLRAIAGARAVRTAITPVWTMPGVEATTGRLTSEAQRIIDDARMSIVCSSFNFTPHSGMWTALENAAARPGLSVTVYLDAHAGSPAAVAAHLPKATVLRTLTLTGGHQPLVSHAKFIVVDRAITLLTSANFSYSAENTNIELGLLVHDTNLAKSIETLMRSKHGILYEKVT
ncbi:cardiolipin synthase [Micromonospora globispora]|uniref:DISARM system phospholipase D-like protein DrmC n=2 Tax=Micromonospora globispora TaxID=1450148 RepID=UPI000D6F3BDA|nr:DISARM system phospholipase D-like protein DrmC [Micromonospora globispora]PWU61859.1 cardiolipin synthase [Micromonospora globispora]RQW98458.1 cardiolipin synthase [Micromonospora globispora]